MSPSDTMPLASRARAESYGPSSPQPAHSRTHSMSSDRPSMTSYGGLLSPPTSTNPEPIYIAASAASQIVTNDHDSQSDSWFDQNGIEPSGETALVAPGALKLVNNFLDQILFNFLSLSRSTSLASLRPAVSEVLKPKLAKDAISLADGELQEYLGGGEDEELLAFHNGLEPSGDWDLELVWKRTRLRCMVYSSLGDMEEEDEDHYTELEQLDGPPGSNNRFSNNPGVVSPAVAIFLTSILEFMGDQVLVVAGQAAYQRLRVKHDKEEREGASTHDDIADRVVVEVMDMERVALDRTLGRLWRGWKKRIRSPTPSLSMGRSFSRESLRSRSHSRINSTSVEPVPHVEEVLGKLSTTETTLQDHAATIPLPIYDDDVREIEIPGVAYQSDDEDDEQSEDEDVERPRPKSLFIPRCLNEPLTPLSSQPASPALLSASTRKRSNSLPSPATSASLSPAKKSKASHIDVTTAEKLASQQDPRLEESSQEQQIQNPTNDETGHEVSPEQDKAVKAQSGSESRKGTLAGVIASAAAVGSVTVAGIAAVATGGAPEALETPDEESDMEDEEPQIMTSSRVSIHGGIPLEQGTTNSRPGSIRSQSVHSLRLVDVSSPRSPTRSRGGSVGSMEQIIGAHPASLSRSGSLHSHMAQEGQIPRGTSPISRVATNSPIIRNGSSLSSRQARNSASNSISELEEQLADPPRSIPAAPVAIPERSPLREAMIPPSVPAVSSLRRENEKSQMPTNAQQFGERLVSLVNPAARSLRETTAIETKNIPNSANGTLSSPTLKTPDTGVPPLTPLREMMEGGQDTSDDASSFAPSFKAQSDVLVHSPIRSSSKVPHNQYYTDVNGSPEQPRTVRGVAAERTRVSPSHGQREDDVTPKPETYGKAGRKIHTSSSSTSSGSHKLRPIRTSEDGMPSAGEDKGRSFEQLIQSDQTIQYTLTPQTMRELESPDSPRNASLPQPPYAKGGDRPRTSSSASRFTALNSHPSPTAESKASRNIPRPTANTGAKVRTGAPQARDARVERESIGDFAEFIRSTGPPGATFDDLPPRSAPAVNGHRGQNGTVRNANASSPRIGAPSGTPRRSQSSATRRLQAREAVVPQSDNSSDLIDFIRQGPPSDKTHGIPRIPRAVAPFRTTMDSDQMSGSVGARVSEIGGPEPRGSQASTNMSNENSMRSVQSSVNSQSALLNNHNSKKPSPPHKFNKFDDDDMMPKRKTRRVRDPYAIDLSDEEDEFDMLPAKPASQEESLAEFLRNVPPPPELATPAVSQGAVKPVAKKASAPSLMARLSARNSNSHSKTPSHSASQSTSRAKNNAPQSPNHIPIAPSKSIISSSSASSPASTKRVNSSSTSNYVSHLDSERKPTKVLQKSYEPREAAGTRGQARTATSDLADFLRNTAPPPSNGPQRLSVGPEPKEEGGFAKMFGRRKKATAA